MPVIKGVYRAYSSSANLGPGFDVMAVALNAYHDDVEVKVTTPGSRHVEVRFYGEFSTGIAPEKSTVMLAAKELLSRTGICADVEVSVTKGIPVGKGLGSSGASAAGIVRALNDLLGLELGESEEVLIAGEGERASAGVPHYDNVAASLHGWLTIVFKGRPGIEVRSYRVRATFVIAAPNLATPPSKTEVMRSVIPRVVNLGDVVANQGNLAALVTGLLLGDLALAGKGMEDHIVVPARAKYIPCFYWARDAAMNAGALGFTLSGAGPSTIALVPSEAVAKEVSRAVKEAYKACGISADVVIARPAPGVLRID